MRIARSHAAVILAGIGTATLLAQEDQPRFQSSVEVTSLDVLVIDSRGQPITDLRPEEFSVRAGDIERNVVSAEWISLGTPSSDNFVPPPEGYSTNENTGGGRLILLVIDQPHITSGNVLAIQGALNEFLDKLPATDRVAAVGLGPGGLATTFTTNRETVKQAVARMPGSKALGLRADFSISLTEALDAHRGGSFLLNQAIARECLGLQGEPLRLCAVNVEGAANAVAIEAIYDGKSTLDSLRLLLQGLRGIGPPKTLIIVSEGFVIGDGPVPTDDLERMAAEARATVYALQLDPRDFDVTRSRAPIDQLQDRALTGDGLAALANVARGALFNVSASASTVFQRLDDELSGYYLVGIASASGDKGTIPPRISVRVTRRGATIRSRRRLPGTAVNTRFRQPREMVASALGTPLILPGLPLRVATFSLRAAEQGNVQLLIHADVGGAEYSSSRLVTLGYYITDEEGRIVESQAADARLPPLMNGVPSALQFTGGASLAPGEYTLKLAVVEGDRVGSIEHPIHAALNDAGEVQLSDLTVGGPPAVPDLIRPTVGPTVSFGILHGYVEAYGDRASDLSATFEIASRSDTPAILSSSVTASRVSSDRVLFSRAMSVRQLPPGDYVLRAIIALKEEAGGDEIETITRSFEVAAPAVLLTSADSVVPRSAAPTELFLPVEDQLFQRPFSREEMSRSKTLETFRALVAPSGLDAFNRGVSLLEQGDYTEAETSFKSAIEIDADMTGPMTYLAGVFAAAGHDEEAASAWQTALIRGSDRPEIYRWLADTLLRAGDLAQARIFLDEAVQKWPADASFAKPLALVYAVFGQGREAVRSLERHLEAFPEDTDALALGVEWIYNLHLEGYVAYSPGRDVEMARAFADAYVSTEGPLTELVREWLAFLEGRDPR